MEKAPVVRGGRGPSRGEMEHDVLAARRQREEELRERSDDLRLLLQQPGFVRYIRYLLGPEMTCAHGQHELFSAEVYALNAKRALGIKIWNDMTRAEPRAALLFLDIPLDDKEP